MPSQKLVQYDLSNRMAPFLDRHLVFPLLEFLQVRELYPVREIMEGKIELLGKTNMVDFAMDIHKALYETEDVPEALVERRKEVVQHMKSLQQEAETIVQFLSDPATVGKLRPDKLQNIQMLQEDHQIGPTQIDALYHFAKFQFECGNYSAASEFLTYYRTLSTDVVKNFSALWGKLCSEILMQNWDVALEDLTRLREIIDSQGKVPPLVQLQQRTWLLHWAMFIFFNHENGRNLLIDMCFHEKYLNAIQTQAPHILRYLAVAVVISKRKRSVLKDLLKIIEQEKHYYQDPVTEFLVCLFVNYDFDGAQEKLRECDEILANDFFLTAYRESFIEAARLFVFETYCRIHSCIDMHALADKLNMNDEEAEKWIINLIRNAKLEAKVDVKAGTVVMGTSQPTVHEQIIEKTVNMAMRSYNVAYQARNSGVAAPAAPAF